MKLIRYTLLPNGVIPDYVIDGGHFAKLNSNDPPQDNDLIGFSESNTGLEEYTVKSDFENYVKSFNPDYIESFNEKEYLQDKIDSMWDRI
jgi:hypothetical protein